MMTDYFDAYAALHRPYKGGPWCYEDGLVYRGLEALHRFTGEARWLAHITRMVDVQIGPEPSLAGYDTNDYNIDNILPGRTLLYLHKVTGDQRYLEAAGLLAGQLVSQPRTKSGVYWHKLRYPWQVWLDGLYMGLPFQIAFGQRVGKRDLIDDALAQFGTALDIAHTPETGLYAHAVDEARKQRWADPETGQSRAHWARALGWLAMAMVDIRELVGSQDFAPLQARTETLLTDLERLRQPSGFWLQVIDQPDLPANYQESSASAMFVYALLKGAALGLYQGPVGGLYPALAERFVKPKAGGGQEMVEMCEVAGLGLYQDRFRDGSAAYYVSEAQATDDPKGVGPLMMAQPLASALVETGEPIAARG